MTVAIVIQARMGSTRLPGKVLKPVCGKSLLAHLVERLRFGEMGQMVRSGEARIIVATTLAQADEAIVRECEALGVQVVRGSEQDVLSRYILAAQLSGAETIVRLTADCPLLDPLLVLGMIEYFSEAEIEYLSNGIESGLPLGQSVEVFSAAALQRAFDESTQNYEREHVTPYLYEQPGRFAIAHLGWPSTIKRSWPEDLSKYRWTVDTEEDFELVQRIFESGYREGEEFGIGEILKVLEKNPQWSALNSEVRQKGYRESQAESEGDH